MTCTTAQRAPRYALKLGCCLPGDLPAPASYPFATDESEDWYVVVVVPGGERATIEDVRRSDWELPEGVIDWRHK